MTDVLDASPASLARAAECLRAGGLVAFPTETVYGLGAHALDVRAVRRVFDAKGRPANDPLIVHVRTVEDVRGLAVVSEVAERLARRFWPGPLTLVLPKKDHVPPEVTAGLSTVAVRVPAHPVARGLLEAAKIPIAAPSANLFSRPSPTRAQHVLQDLDGRIDLVIDGGATDLGLESTVLDLTSTPPTILRPGALTLEHLGESVAGVRWREEGRIDAVPASPGLMPKHYSPRAPLTLFSGPPEAAVDAIVTRARAAAAHGRRVGVLLAREDVDAFGDFPVHLAEIGTADDPAGIAARLYAAMRQLDAAGVDVILARDVTTDEGVGRAIRDRLQRAASERVRLD